MSPIGPSRRAGGDSFKPDLDTDEVPSVLPGPTQRPHAAPHVRCLQTSQEGQEEEDPACSDGGRPRVVRRPTPTSRPTTDTTSRPTVRSIPVVVIQGTRRKRRCEPKPGRIHICSGATRWMSRGTSCMQPTPDFSVLRACTCDDAFDRAARAFDLGILNSRCSSYRT